jgi:hypothetical protein
MKTKLIVAGYRPEDENYPVLQIRSAGRNRGPGTQFCSHVVRRTDPCYVTLLDLTKDGKDVVWIYGQMPQPLL